MDELASVINAQIPDNIVGFDARQSMRRCRIALYSHDTMGLGHMRRNLLIAQTLAASPIKPTILMVAGARELGAYALPSDVDCVVLPSYHKQLDGNYISRHLDVEGNELKSLRANTICTAIKSFNPDVFIVDNVARGALGELDITLQYLRSQRHTRCVLGLRDIQDQTKVSRARYKAEEQAYVDYYDSIWIYGDPKVFDLAEDCAYIPEIASKVHYTGYLDQTARTSNVSDYKGSDEIAALSLPPGKLILCMLGGGQDGERLAKAFVDIKWPDGYNGVLVAGPYMPKDIKQYLHKSCEGMPNLRVLGFVDEPTIFLKEAYKVITMGGYNSVCEVLSYNKKALIVPRIKPRMEQWVRAQRLNEMKLIDILHPNEISSNIVKQWIMSNSLSTNDARNWVNLDGLNTISKLIEKIARV